MKKYIFTLLMALCLGFSAQAGDDLALKSGSLKPLKEGGIGVVNFDFEGAKYDDKKALTAEYSNLNQLIENMIPEFIREFNEEAKKFRLVKETKDECYSINVKITNMDRYVNVMGWKPGTTTKLFGNMTILDPKGETVATLKIDDLQNTGVTVDLSFEEAFEELAETLAKKINKAK